VLVTPGVGDDSAIIEAEAGGAVFDVTQPGSVAAALARLSALLAAPDHRARISELALRHRSSAHAREAYAALLPVSRARA
jgi:hypothetical protein